MCGYNNENNEKQRLKSKKQIHSWGQNRLCLAAGCTPLWFACGDLLAYMHVGKSHGYVLSTQPRTIITNIRNVKAGSNYQALTRQQALCSMLHLDYLLLTSQQYLI